MYSGTVIKPYWDFEVGERIYVKELDYTNKWCANIYRTKESFQRRINIWGK